MCNWFRAFILILIPVIAAEAVSVDSLRFYQVEADLSQHSVTRIIQDKQGFLWFATRYGLNRYDGENILSFYGKESQDGTLGNSFIKDLALDARGNLYIATFGGGVNTWHEGRFGQLKGDSTLANLLVNNVTVDQDGNIWIGTDKSGVIRVPSPGDESADTGLRHFRHYAGDPYTLSGNSTTASATDGHGNVWIGTWDQGLNVYLQENSRFMRFTAANNSNLPGDIIRSISRAPDGSLWVGFQKGIRRISYTGDGYEVNSLETGPPSLTRMLETLTVLSILHDEDNRLWIGTENEGLIVIDLNTGRFGQYKKSLDNPFSVGSNSIWSLYQDRAGTIWVGTFDQGVFKVDPHEVRFDHIAQIPYSSNTLSHSLVSSFAPDETGGLWIGTDGGGLNHMSADGTFSVLHTENSPLRSSSILSLQKDEDNNLWIGGWRSGLSMIPAGTEDLINFPFEAGEEGTGGRLIFDLDKDPEGNIWIASYRTSVDVYLPDQKRFLHFTPEDSTRYITANTVQAIAAMPDGSIWIGTEGSGIDKLEVDDQYRTKSLKNYSLGALHEESHSSITSLYIDKKGRLWAGTRGDGLALYLKDEDRFTTITTADGLPSNLIYTMEEDQEGKLWLSTNRGIVAYDPASGDIETFDVADGLQALEFFPKASYTLQDGTMLFGGINGFNRFHPTDIAAIPLNGDVYITSVQTSGSDKGDMRPGSNLLIDGELDLSYKNNDFNISFSYLNFTQASKNRYQYRLEGYDEEWQNVGTRNTAFYTNVPAGVYTFQVRAANADQVWAPMTASLPIRIRPPWYGTWGAYAFYGILILGFLMWRRHTIIQRVKLKNKLALEHLELEKMKELDEIKSRFFANISHEFRTPLTLILSPLKSMIFDDRIKDYHPRLKSMSRQAERLLSFINQILDLSKVESGSARLEARHVELGALLKPLAYTFTNLAEKQYIRYKVITPEKPVMIYADTDKLEKIITNLLSNAFKFTPDFGEISLSLVVRREEVCISVSDSGEGISRENLNHVFRRYYQGKNEGKRQGLGTGIGLALTKELVELHRGRIEVNSDEGKGTTFKVYLPLGKDHLKPAEIVVGEVEAKIYEQISAPEEEVSPAPAESQTEKAVNRGKILVAEDNREIRSFIKEYLEGEFDVMEAPDGVKALELVKNQKPDLVVTDILMPKMNGFELVNAIKNDESLNHIPTIMLTAKASADSMEEGYELGADYYITKPFNPTHLRLQINNILKARKSYKERVKSGKHINLAPRQIQVAREEEELIARVMKVIEQHISDPNFTVNELCKAVGMSRMKLYRKLKANISMSANELIRHVRLQRAAQLIKEKQHSISEITYIVGFTDLQYFRNSFKKHFGVNPSDYQ
ncbi:two-component regulator propeller domain-containing protein [Roseivirga sp. BDSF3-8]|uniref:hybrid sensor histidine kinase/response regulator transcription factor n=1 Tax=Roseivirga sp. BDSF3-8 TaxID=3241598 RepID=UPI00353249E7